MLKSFSENSETDDKAECGRTHQRKTTSKQALSLSLLSKPFLK